mmetsp:Transcript_60436/g.112239  ORF Transcript_60436/g.112239 Transcript_60436/m.112239 type:complete len:469 (+) Transcript_60436:45-1451(+)
MPANALRRPQLLAGQAKANLQSTQAAHRERLQNASRRTEGSDAGRPPILPPLSKAGGGYPRDEVGTERPEVSGPARPLGPKSPRGLRAVSLDASAGHRTQQSGASPSSSRSSARRTSKGSSPQGVLVPTPPPGQEPDDELEAEEEDEEEDDEFLEDLAELDRLAQHLNRGHAGGADAGNDSARPASGTSISASTTVPCGSSVSEATFGTEDGDEVHATNPQPPRAEDISENPLEFLQGAQRVHHELQSCTLPPGCRVECTPGSRAQFFFNMDVAEGPYTPATLTFWIKIFEDFPAPGGYSIRCTKSIFHPNVSPEDRGFLLPSQQEGGASSSSTALVPGGPRHYPFRDMLLEIRRCICSPCDSPAANADAAMLLQTDPDEFRRVVRTTLNGGDYRGVRFDQVLNLSRFSKSAQDATPLALQDAEPKRAPMSEKLRLGMMKLEVMRDDFNAQASAWQHANSLECKKLLT